ncbi:nucleotide-diphosphate-sugar epimerase [Phytohabitans rumicis]|uniref:Nucleotide-diphosphate-sugar epimerase n=2 Tax=Phytohabitans rumicis TaxID=1076125 RepID=A0A6V8L959_9ACTN|nr:nucleotide-diphosphate-sugar epimerase [Phytohabitans rumicis]
MLDLATGEGLAEAVAGLDAVVHLASATRQYRKAAAVDVAGTRRLVTAAAQAGVRHVVYVSIVGIDRVPFGYYKHKLAAEQVVRSGPVPWTILRATQFPQLLDERLLPMASTLGVLLGDPEVKMQLVDPRDVADRIAGMLAAGPSRAIEEYGGPEVLTFAEIVEPWLRARGKRRPVLRLRLPGATVRAMRAGALTTDAVPTGTRTWREYLAERYEPMRRSQA